jgi:phospholipid transport system transporter-binding protein
MIRESNDRLYVSGPVTLENVMQFVEAGARYLDGVPKVFDFSEATEIDSASVSLILEWSRRARDRGAQVRFANLGESIRSLIDLYGVGNLIQLDAQ